MLGEVGRFQLPDEVMSMVNGVSDRDLLRLLTDLRADGRTIPEFRIKVRPTSAGDVVQLALLDQDIIEQLEIPLKTLLAEDGRLYGEAERLVKRRMALRAP